MLYLKHYYLKCIIKVNFWGIRSKGKNIFVPVWYCDLTWPLSGLNLTCLRWATDLTWLAWFVCTVTWDLMVGTWDLLETWTCVTCPHLCFIHSTYFTYSILETCFIAFTKIVINCSWKACFFCSFGSTESTGTVTSSQWQRLAMTSDCVSIFGKLHRTAQASQDPTNTE